VAQAISLICSVSCACCRVGGRAACSFSAGCDVWYAEAIAEQLVAPALTLICCMLGRMFLAGLVAGLHAASLRGAMCGMLRPLLSSCCASSHIDSAVCVMCLLHGWWPGCVQLH
jgi:hypothetical protein